MLFGFSIAMQRQEKGSAPIFMKWPIVLLRILLMSLLCSSGATQARKAASAPLAAQQPEAAESKTNETPHDMTAADVGAFLDGFMPMQLQRENIAGAVVLVVKNGQVLFAKGYCYTDVDKKTSVSVDATLFRPRPISHLLSLQHFVPL